MTFETTHGVIRTVLGEIPARKLGPTLIHEHLSMDSTPLLTFHGYDSIDSSPHFDLIAATECRWNPGSNPRNYQLTEIDAIATDVLLAKDEGIQSIVDVTPIDMGRSPGQLRAIAERTGVQIIMGTGYYLRAAHASHLPPGSEEELAFERIVTEHHEGVLGVYPGIIGEIGTGNPLEESEVNVLRGAARAAHVTGLALSVHVHPWGYTGLDVLGTVSDLGLDPYRVVLGHMNTAIDRPDYLRKMLETGVTLGFDLFGFDHSLLHVGRYPPSDWEVAKMVAVLVDEGYVDQLVLSQDVGVRSRLTTYGGWGYAHLTKHVVPMMVNLGIDQSAIDRMLTDNCARILTVGGR
jgi:phosphotriesterase-related protein